MRETRPGWGAGMGAGCCLQCGARFSGFMDRWVGAGRDVRSDGTCTGCRDHDVRRQGAGGIGCWLGGKVTDRKTFYRIAVKRRGPSS